MTVWTAHRYAVIDVEGNGHQPPDLVELAIVSIDAGRIGEPVSWLVQQHQPITPMARRIHRITDVMVADAPPFTEVEGAIRTHLDGSVLVAHNAGVDLGVLRRKMPDFTPTAVLDTLRLSRRLLPDQRRASARSHPTPGQLRRTRRGPAVCLPGHHARRDTPVLRRPPQRPEAWR